PAATCSTSLPVLSRHRARPRPRRQTPAGLAPDADRQPASNDSTSSPSSTTPKDPSHEPHLPSADRPLSCPEPITLPTRQENTRICILGCVSVPGPLPGCAAGRPGRVVVVL